MMSVEQDIIRLKLKLQSCSRHKKHVCNEYWCHHCGLIEQILLGNKVNRWIDKKPLLIPVFTTILLQSVDTPSPRQWRPIYNRAIDRIDDRKDKGYRPLLVSENEPDNYAIPGIWFFEIAYKRDLASSVCFKHSGPNLCHLHGIISIADVDKIKTLFPLPNQTRCENIGLAERYRHRTLEENISRVVKYSTKRANELDIKQDAAMMAINRKGFPQKFTGENMRNGI